jgi:hypothetical protein
MRLSLTLSTNRNHERWEFFRRETTRFLANKNPNTWLLLS